MCPEQTGSHQSRARVGRGTHQIRIREPTIRRGHQKNVHPCMSNEVEVLEGGVSKDAVFGRKVGGDDVRVVHEVARPGSKRSRASARLRPRGNIPHLQSSPLHSFTPQLPQHPSLKDLNAQYISTSSQVCREKLRCIDQVTNKLPNSLT